jgi:hypothetical protein
VDGGSLVVNASLFEINSSDSSTNADRKLSGYIDIDNPDEELIKKLKQLCSKRDVDKLVIVYQNYEFVLVGVSLNDERDFKDLPKVHVRRLNRYRFTAKDIGLKTFDTT